MAKFPFSKPFLTVVARLTWADLIEGEEKTADDGKKYRKYTGTLLFDKNSKEQANPDKNILDIAGMKAVAQATFLEAYPDESNRPRKIATPFKDGDTDENSDGIPLSEKYPYYANNTVVSMSTTRAPGCIDANGSQISDENKLYSGCFVRAQLQATLYEFNGKKGLRFVVQNILKVSDGDKLGGSSESAESAFAGLVTDTPKTETEKDTTAAAAVTSIF